MQNKSQRGEVRIINQNPKKYIMICSTIHVLLRLIVIILVCVHPTTEPDNRNYWPNYENLDEFGLPENDEYDGKQTGSTYGKPRMESPTYQNTIYENMNEDETHKSASSSASPYGRNTFSYDLSNLASHLYTRS